MRSMSLVFAVVVLSTVVARLPAAEYVVDNQNPVASDENPGTWDRPWKTVGHAAGAAGPGQIVCVMEGVYDETLTPKHSGSPDASIVFRGVPRHKARLKGADTGKASYVRVEGFRFDGEGVSVSGDHVRIVDNEFHEARRTTVGGSGANITVAYNRSVSPSSGIFASGQDWVAEANEIERMVHQTSECDYGRFFGKGHVFRRNYFHGTVQEEVGKSHVDGFQTYNLKAREDLQAHNMSILDNVVFNFHQAIIARSAEPGFLSNFMIRGNIFAHGLLPNEKGAAVGLIFESVPGVTVEQNLIADVQWFAFSPSKTTDGVIRGNIIWKVGNFDRGRRPEGLKVDHNISFETKTELPEDTFINEDPKFVDVATDSWRLQPDSPAIGAGADGLTLGPFAWPNVYCVDVLHPGASDNAGLGHPGRPFKTLTHALKVAKPGESIIVYGGVYRECPVATADDVTVRAAVDSCPVITGTDVIEGWQRDAAGWSVPMAETPNAVLCNGEPDANATHDLAAGRLRVKGVDPRLSLYEVVVREHAMDLSGKRVRVENIGIGQTLGLPIAGAENAAIIGGE